MMNRNNWSGRKRRPWMAALLVFGFMAAMLPAALNLAALQARVELDFFDLSNDTERRDGFYIMRDEADGSLVLRTARLLHVGDQFINRDNNHYRVVRLDGDTAWARLVEEAGRTRTGTIPAVETILPVQGDNRVIGVYHSHGAESYVPSDGTDSIDEGGGILQVGEVFAQNLERQGVNVLHSTETHVPHDAGAYNRSRRTAEELLGERPDALFDVHRDAVPPGDYRAEVDGQEMVQVLFVVGRQNQNVESNQAFAQGLKNTADERYPGLVKGILLAQGSFNQDLSPRSLLLEVGAHENTREQAEEAVTVFADVATGFLYGTGQGGEFRGVRPDTRTGAGGIAMQSALKLLVALAIALFVYLLIAAGSWEEFKRKAASFFQREFADLRRGFDRRGGRRGDGEDS